jgi:hypothetical protein
VDENALSFNRDTALVGEVADGEHLDPCGALDISLRAKTALIGTSHKPPRCRDGSGHTAPRGVEI